LRNRCSLCGLLPALCGEVTICNGLFQGRVPDMLRRTASQSAGDARGMIRPRERRIAMTTKRYRLTTLCSADGRRGSAPARPAPRPPLHLAVARAH
jgi:hypothetical protein